MLCIKSNFTITLIGPNELGQEIRGEREEDSGSYECRAENEVGSDSRFYQVTVLGKLL